MDKWVNRKEKIIQKTSKYKLVYNEYYDEYQIRTYGGWEFITINNLSEDNAEEISKNILELLDK